MAERTKTSGAVTRGAGALVDELGRAGVRKNRVVERARLIRKIGEVRSVAREMVQQTRAEVGGLTAEADRAWTGLRQAGAEVKTAAQAWLPVRDKPTVRVRSNGRFASAPNPVHEQFTAAKANAEVAARRVNRAHEALQTGRDTAAESLRTVRRVEQAAVKTAKNTKYTLAGKIASKVKSAVEPVGGFIKRHVSPFKPGAGGSLTGKAAKAVLGAVPKAGAWVDRAATRWVGRHFARNLVGRTLGGVVRAPFSAGGFAASAWIDAGIQAYDFIKDSNAREGFWDDKDARIDKAGFARDFAMEAAKGLGRMFTFGFLGSGDALDASMGGESGGRALASEAVKRADSGNKAHKVEEVMRQHRELTAENSKKGIPVDAQGLRHYLESLASTRDARLSRYASIRDNWDQAVQEHGSVLGRTTKDEYYDQAVARETARYDRSVAEALANPVAKSLIERNRNEAYSWYSDGRNWADDYKAEGQKPGSVQGFRGFQDAWGGMKDVERALWSEQKQQQDYDGIAAQGAIDGGETRDVDPTMRLQSGAVV